MTDRSVPAVDLRKRQVNVTERDLALGCASDSMECPVARAMKRAFHADRVSVGYDEATVWMKDGGRLDARLPVHVFEKIWAFDHDDTVPSASSLSPLSMSAPENRNAEQAAGKTATEFWLQIGAVLAFGFVVAPLAILLFVAFLLVWMKAFVWIGTTLTGLPG